MRIYIIDGDRNVRSELKRMIEEGNLGQVDGMSADWEDAYPRMKQMRPDILLAELIRPPLKSMVYLQKMKETSPGTAVLLLSQNHEASLVFQAYERGAELLIHKPVQAAEIRNVLHNLEMTRTMEWLISRAGNGVPVAAACMAARSTEEALEKLPCVEVKIRRLKGILHEIGILSEAGSRDIIALLRYLMEQKLDSADITVGELCCRLNQNPKSVEQRIRRAAASGMANLAARGLEDYADPVFNEYAGKLYSFEQIKKEMNYVRGKSDRHGNVRMKNFLGGLMECCELS